MAAKEKKQEAESDPNVQKGECLACKAADVPLKDVEGMMICGNCASKRFSHKVRKTIQEAFERRQEQLQMQAWQKRMATARRATDLYEAGKYSESLRALLEYVAILERRYGVAPGGLSPGLFDPVKEGHEVLLLAGIYWDMAKIYDRIKNRRGEMRHALNKFVEFSVDRPHLILASEGMRRYINSDKCVNRIDFNNTHRILRSRLAKCFIASAVFGPTSPEVLALREFRDRRLMKSAAGRALVEAYYRLSPPIAETLYRTPSAAAVTRVVLRPLTKLLKKWS